MKIRTNNLPYRISPNLVTLLETMTEGFITGSVTINFRDVGYSSESGGYHPIEIRITDGDTEYITDFCYVGSGQDAELVKEIDFDFSNKVFGHIYWPDSPLENGNDLFEIWQQNFLIYVKMGAYETSTTTD